MSKKKIKAAVVEARKRKLQGNEKASTFVRGDVVSGVIRDPETEEKKDLDHDQGRTQQ